MKPRLLDLFCGAGGAAMGYHRAGFEVVGVDINPQPNYPFEFHRADSLSVLGAIVNGVGGPAIEHIDVIHASPPCQSYSKALRHMAAPQPQLIGPVTELLEKTWLPWVIENVPGAPLPNDATLFGTYGAELCGTQFGMRIGWHRLFESNVHIQSPIERCFCSSIQVINPFNQAGRDRIYDEFGPAAANDWPEHVWRKERGTEWMSRYEAREAIPPAYTENIGRQLLAHIQAVAA